MTDWLGMAAPPRTPRPELKARALARAFAAGRRPRWIVPLAAAATLALVAAGVAAVRAIRGLRSDLAVATATAQAKDDTLSLLRDAATRVVHIPVSTNGQLGAVTIFADSASHRWLVTCHHLAPNQPGQAYQLWFLTSQGPRSALVMPMDEDRPMMATLTMPEGAGTVTGAAMTIEPRAGSAEPTGPMVFRLTL